MNKEEGKNSIDKASGFNRTLSRTYALRAQYHGSRADAYGKLFSERLISLFKSLVFIAMLPLITLPFLIPFFPPTFIEALKKRLLSQEIENYLLLPTLFISATGILIWLGTYYKSREKEERILEEEYSHKETLVKFFEEYSSLKDISSDKEVKHIVLDLHKHVIDSAAYNPSIRLGKENSDHPTIKILNELNNNLTKVVDKTRGMSGKIIGKSKSG